MKRIMNAWMEGMERSAQRQARQYLLGLSDSFLKDMGISRELLKQGPDAWPWRLEEAPRGDLKLSANTSSLDAQSGSPLTSNDRNTGEKLAA